MSDQERDKVRESIEKSIENGNIVQDFRRKTKEYNDAAVKVWEEQIAPEINQSKKQSDDAEFSDRMKAYNDNREITKREFSNDVKTMENATMETATTDLSRIFFKHLFNRGLFNTDAPLIKPKRQSENDEEDDLNDLREQDDIKYADSQIEKNLGNELTENISLDPDQGMSKDITEKVKEVAQSEVSEVQDDGSEVVVDQNVEEQIKEEQLAQEENSETAAPAVKKDDEVVTSKKKQGKGRKITDSEKQDESSEKKKKSTKRSDDKYDPNLKSSDLFPANPEKAVTGKKMKAIVPKVTKEEIQKNSVDLVPEPGHKFVVSDYPSLDLMDDGSIGNDYLKKQDASLKTKKVKQTLKGKRLSAGGKGPYLFQVPDPFAKKISVMNKTMGTGLKVVTNVDKAIPVSLNPISILGSQLVNFVKKNVKSASQSETENLVNSIKKVSSLRR